MKYRRMIIMKGLQGLFTPGLKTRPAVPKDGLPGEPRGRRPGSGLRRGLVEETEADLMSPKTTPGLRQAHDVPPESPRLTPREGRGVGEAEKGRAGREKREKKEKLIGGREKAWARMATEKTADLDLRP